MAPILSRGRPAGGTGRWTRAASGSFAGVALFTVFGLLLAACGQDGRAMPGAAAGEVRIAAGAPATLDPASAADQASAAVIAQLFEGLTAFDGQLNVRPALARAWDLDDGGRQVTFHLRPDLTFSDGSPLTADDVVRSWLRLLDPARPAPLAGLLEDIVGAADRLAGRAGPEAVEIRAAGDDVVVELVRPAADFPTIVAGPTFVVVPAAVATDPAALTPGGFVGSGAYGLEEVSSDRLVLRANERFWAGPPAIERITIVTDLGGRGPVDAFESGDVDYVGIGGFDAAWIAYDATLGPQLRQIEPLGIEYYGFDTTKPPFDDPQVRQALAMAVDWARLVELGGGGEATPARSLVPPGIPGRSDRDFGAPHDPPAARALLTQAGYPGGAGFPVVTFMTASGYAGAAVEEWRRELGIEVAVETMDFDAYFTRLAEDPPAIWSIDWIADYPGPDDFLGILLGTGRANNFAGWSSPEFDAAIARAGGATDPAERRAAFDDAEGVVRDAAPVIPIAYDSGWALSRDGLLGARDNGLGIIRFAGLAWADGR